MTELWGLCALWLVIRRSRFKDSAGAQGDADAYNISPVPSLNTSVALDEEIR